MATTRVPATLTALVTTAETAVTSVGCKVYRGPVVTGDFSKALFIGYDGDPAGEFRALSAASEWAGLGAKARDEMFEVQCCITLLSGGGHVASATDEAYEAYALFEAAVRNNPGLNQTPRFTAAVVGGDLFTMPHPSGLQVRLAFSVRVSARI